MKKLQTRFGQIEYDPANALYFPDGLIGFEDLQNFVVMPNEKSGPLFWIQSIENEQIAFVLTDPTNFFLDYNVVPDQKERAKLGLGEKEDGFVLSVVTVHQDRSVTLNLQAPILYAAKSNRAIQVILDKGNHQTRTPLPAIEKTD